MKYQSLREDVCLQNKNVVEAGLVVLTWGNVSGADREAGVMAIKPSGVDYDRLRPEDMVVLSLESGEVVDGALNPSSDTPTHLHLYQRFGTVGGIVHTHSTCATSWSQAEMALPCFGTTHADHFYGPVPVARHLRPEEVEQGYELHTLALRPAASPLSPALLDKHFLRKHGPRATYGQGR